MKNRSVSGEPGSRKRSKKKASCGLTYMQPIRCLSEPGWNETTEGSLQCRNRKKMYEYDGMLDVKQMNEKYRNFKKVVVWMRGRKNGGNNLTECCV
jgi:hypothetical protein